MKEKILGLSFFITGVALALIVSISPNEIPKTPYQERLDNLKKSTVKLIFDNHSGSGGLFSYTDDQGKTLYSILTNAHVCIEDFTAYISDPAYTKEFFNKTTKIDIKGDHALIKVEIKNKDLAFDTDKDFCFIPVKKELFPDENFHFISKPSSPEVKQEAKNKPDHLLLFTRNFAKRNEVFIKKGVYKEYIDNRFYISTKDRKTSLKIPHERSPAAVATIDMIPGDSGSLIFNKELDFVGLAFGYDLKEDLKKTSAEESPLVGDNWDVFDYLELKNIRPEDLPKLKKDMEELSCLFILGEDLITSD